MPRLARTFLLSPSEIDGDVTITGDLTVEGTITDESLTATRVVFVGTGGLLTDDSGMTFTAATNVMNLTGGLSIGATPATTGELRLPTSFVLYGRNAGNTTDLDFIQSDASNNLFIGTINAAGGNTILSARSGATVAVNSLAQDTDFRVEADSNAVAFKLDAGLNGGAGEVQIGTPKITFSAAGTTALGSSNTGLKQVFADFTDISSGVTGNQTISKMAGSVNFAAGVGLLTVTNTLVTTSTKVFASVTTSGSTGVIGSIIPASGSFAINLSTAPAAETRVSWFIVNTD